MNDIHHYLLWIQAHQPLMTIIAWGYCMTMFGWACSYLWVRE